MEMNQKVSQKLKYEGDEEILRMWKEKHEKAKEGIQVKKSEIKKFSQRIQVPIIRLEKTPTIELRSYEIDFSIPRIISDIKKIRITRIPIVRLGRFDIEPRLTELDDVLPTISRLDMSKYLPIPIFVIGSVERDLYISPSLNAEIPHIEPMKRLEEIVPMYTPSSATIEYTTQTFDDEVCEDIRPRVIHEDKISQTIVGSMGGGERFEEDLDVIRHMFGLSRKTRRALYSGEPMVIVVPKEEFLGFVRYLCSRIYREIKGGRAKPRIISNINREYFRNEVERWLQAEDRIFSIEFKENKELDCEFWESFWDRIEELFSQDFGFIILNRDVLYIPQHHIVKWIYLWFPDRLVSDPKAKAELCGAMWGFLDPDDILKKAGTCSSDMKFDIIFEVAREEFKSKLKSIVGRYLYVTKRGENESDTHFMLKLFVVKYIADALELNDIISMRKYIHVEEPWDGVYPDIYVSSDATKFADEVFEIETLFGEGEFSIKKIDETIEKYKKIGNPPQRLNIVLENLTFLMHLEELIERKSFHYKEREHGAVNFELEFWTLDVQNYRLVPLRFIVEKVRALIKKLRMY